MTRLISVIASLAVLGILAAPAPAAGGGATIKLAKVGKLGKVVVNGSGVTLYMFEKDKGGKSACSGACAKVWSPVLTTGKPKAGAGIRASLLGTTTRSGGTKQVTYHRHPLYTYDDDHGPGTAKGQDSHEFGADWYVVDKVGNVVHGDA
jgi:predicted lipoprotein with Yx(FWY)xxD motif